MPRLLLTAIAVMGAAAVVWTRPPDSPLTLTQVQRLLPPGSTVHSLARLDLDGRPPQEVAAVVIVPLLPQSRSITYYSFVFGYNRWRRDFVRMYGESLPAIPVSVDAGRLRGNRDAAIFGWLERSGTRLYRLVGWVGNRASVIHEGRLSDHALAGALSPTVPRANTWRYSVRNGKVVGHASTVHVVPRQVLHVTRVGGGPTTAVVPDTRLDLVEGGGYRARTPGIYTIRIVTPFVPLDQSYLLTVVIAPPAPSLGPQRRQRDPSE